MTTVAHFAFPFRWVAGRAMVVEQDSYQEVEQGVRVLMLSHLGERLEVPGFGIQDPVFQGELDEEAVAQAAAEWDDRVSLAIQETPDRTNAMIRHLLVQVSEREG